MNLEKLKTEIFGKKIHRFSSTTSTNDEAFRRAKNGGAEGEVFIAEAQTKGRGRQGRVWESPSGKNLYISFLLKPDLTPAEASPLTLVAGVAVFETLRPYLPVGEKLTIKWPNDLYVEGRKIAGILTEMESAQDRVHCVVVGIGIDVNTSREDFSKDTQLTAASLKIVTGKEFDRDVIAAALITNFEKRYFEFYHEGVEGILKFCDEHSYLKGKAIQWEGADGLHQGVVIGISPEGFLLARNIKDAEGKIFEIVAGDITICRS